MKQIETNYSICLSQHSKTSAEPSGKLKMISLAIVNFLRAFFGQKSEPTFQAAKFLSKLKKTNNEPGKFCSVS